MSKRRNEWSWLKYSAASITAHALRTFRVAAVVPIPTPIPTPTPTPTPTAAAAPTAAAPPPAAIPAVPTPAAAPAVPAVLFPMLLLPVARLMVVLLVRLPVCVPVSERPKKAVGGIGGGVCKSHEQEWAGNASLV